MEGGSINGGIPCCVCVVSTDESSVTTKRGGASINGGSASINRGSVTIDGGSAGINGARPAPPKAMAAASTIDTLGSAQLRAPPISSVSGFRDGMSRNEAIGFGGEL
eukprot:473062-Rhodomonas_salina.5